MLTIAEVDRIARSEDTCRGCGQDKETGLVVCWRCFKYRDREPFKYFESCDLNEWLVAIGRGAFVIERAPKDGPLAVPNGWDKV